MTNPTAAADHPAANTHDTDPYAGFAVELPDLPPNWAWDISSRRDRITIATYRRRFRVWWKVAAETIDHFPPEGLRPIIVDVIAALASHAWRVAKTDRPAGGTRPGLVGLRAGTSGGAR